MSKPARSSLFDPALIQPAVFEAFRKLDPRVQWREPGHVRGPGRRGPHNRFHNRTLEPLQFSDHALALVHAALRKLRGSDGQGRGKAQAATLRRIAHDHDGAPAGEWTEEKIAACDLRKGDTAVCEANDIIPGDGEVIDGIASVDESAITGESAPVIRESGGDRARSPAAPASLKRPHRHASPASRETRLSIA